MKGYTQKHQGFTLIEMVVVIVLIGILAAVALPKFTDMSTNAKISTVDGLAGAIHSTVALAASNCIVAPTCTRTTVYSASSGNTADIEGTTYLFHYGNITAWDAGGNVSDLVFLDGFTVAPYVGGSYARVFTFDQGGTPANCSVTYTLSNNSSDYSITKDTSGC
ncbi:MAG: type II secretion system protein [Gammaproteobacteria bacterium]|nr:type II secretion system protein [Gammaproteobacteria bacterium]